MNGQTLYGKRIIVSPDTKRTLPDEVCPGVPWPPGFKEEIDAWMASFFTPKNLIPDGITYVTPTGIYMNPRTYDAARKTLADQSERFRFA